MIAPLINILKYKGNTPFGSQLLLGTATDIPSLNGHIKNFLKKIRAIKERLLPPDTLITQQEYTKEVNRIREATS